ncbi:KIF-binding protein-like [Temnothorax nylanderi]|uniref:KIF-binding protein-like n=1 Tax=Temnothorax nylanderi TaxID=102681 RepID=UPI003A8B4E4F
MKISKKFLDVLQLSFEIKYMNGDIAPAKKRNQSKEKKRIKVIEERMDVLYHNVIDVLTDQEFDDIVALAATYCNIGLQYVHSTELDDLNHAVHCFIRCLELLKGKRDDRKAILTSINAINQLSLVSEKADMEVPLYKSLNAAFRLYFEYTRNYTNPIHIASLVGIKEKESNPWIILNTLHHTTLQGLGLEYLKRPSSKNIYQFVLYVENTLNIRLRDILVFDKIKIDEKCLDMALTLFDLSKSFLANGHFVKAKNYIAIADYVIHKFVETRLAETAKRINCFCLSKKYIYARAVSTKSWGSYGVSLLRFWMEKFSQNKDSKSSEIQDSMSELEIKFELPNSIFPALEKELKHVTIEITETCTLNLTDAKSVFEKTWTLLERVKGYFTADSNIKMYAMITLKISDAFKYLAGFEEQRDDQIELHKRRIECLEDVRKKFHTTIEDDREIQIYKRICYEVVTSCSTVMDLMAEETYYDESFKELSMKTDQYAKMIADNIGFYLNTI